MKTLNINHELYGYNLITEPVLIDLINSAALARLKKIDQAGAWQLHKSYKQKFTRYDHSIGVMLLLRKFNAPLEEQIHGLLHDISHTAFSHVADFLFNQQTSHGYQDSRIKKAYALQGINQILKKYKISSAYILNEKNFPLAERDLPAICADRIDYTLQDPVGQSLDNADPKQILKDLTVYKNQFVFKTKTGAKKFADLNLKLNEFLWCAPLQVALYEIMADVLRQAIKNKIIDKKDLYQTDKFILDKLIKAQNKDTLAKMKKIKTLKIKIVSKNQADFWSTSKSRVVDPLFIKNNKLIKLTAVDEAYKNQINSWTKKVKKGFYIKVIN